MKLKIYIYENYPIYIYFIWRLFIILFLMDDNKTQIKEHNGDNNNESNNVHDDQQQQQQTKIQLNRFGHTITLSIVVYSYIYVYIYSKLKPSRIIRWSKINKRII